MRQNHLDARSACRSLWALLGDTFTRRSTPLTILDVLEPAPASLQPDRPGAYRWPCPVVPCTPWTRAR
jgi:hypothetical protein